MTQTNSNRFLTAFIQIEMYLKNYLSNPSIGFSQMVTMASKTNSIVSRYSFDLLEYAQLRNAIVHNRVERVEVIAEPHDRIVKDIERIEHMLNTPRLLREYASKNVFVCQSGDLLSDVLKTQHEKNYSVVPVYDQSRYIGAIHTKLYQRYLEHHHNQTISANNIMIKELLDLNQQDERVSFVSHSADLFDAIAIYEKLMLKGKVLIAIIMTENGRMNERPTAILTVADFIKIYQELE